MHCQTVPTVHFQHLPTIKCVGTEHIGANRGMFWIGDNGLVYDTSEEYNDIQLI